MTSVGFAGEDIACLRGERLVFARLGFTVAPGEVLLLAGPNGSGKSSLLRLMAGLLRPAAGRLTWNGQPITADPDAHRARLIYVGHQDAVKPTLTVTENLGFWADLAGGGAGRAALEAFGLEALATMPAGYLSAGQRRRTALSRLIVSRAPLWLLDEPTLGLDQRSVEALEATILRHTEQRGLAIIATHAAMRVPLTRTLALDQFVPRPAAAA